MPNARKPRVSRRASCLTAMRWVGPPDISAFRRIPADERYAVAWRRSAWCERCYVLHAWPFNLVPRAAPRADARRPHSAWLSWCWLTDVF